MGKPASDKEQSHIEEVEGRIVPDIDPADFNANYMKPVYNRLDKLEEKMNKLEGIMGRLEDKLDLLIKKLT